MNSSWVKYKKAHLDLQVWSLLVNPECDHGEALMLYLRPLDQHLCRSRGYLQRRCPAAVTVECWGGETLLITHLQERPNGWHAARDGPTADYSHTHRTRQHMLSSHSAHSCAPERHTDRRESTNRWFDGEIVWQKIQRRHCTNTHNWLLSIMFKQNFLVFLLKCLFV